MAVDDCRGAFRSRDHCRDFFSYLHCVLDEGLKVSSSTKRDLKHHILGSTVDLAMHETD